MMKVVSHHDPENPHRPRRRRLRTVAVLPTLLTLGNMICGFSAIYFCMLGLLTADVDPALKATLNSPLVEQFLPTFISVGGFLIFLGMFFDMMDGRVARMTSSTTNFGGQLDSLADMVTFGIAPAMLVISLVTLEARIKPDEVLVTTRGAWMGGAIFAACAALRLARYNVEHADTGTTGYTSFRGLPSPGAGAVLASLVVLYEHVAELRGIILVNAFPVIAFVAGLLMVSRVRYVHVGNVYLRGKKPFAYVMVMVIGLGLLIRFPSQTLAGVVCAYAISGPLGEGWRLIRPKNEPASHNPAAPNEESPDSSEKTA